LSKKRSGCGTFFCDNTYAAILFSEHYYDNRYNVWVRLKDIALLAPDKKGIMESMQI
jgi:hypothetical protein